MLKNIAIQAMITIKLDWSIFEIDLNPLSGQIEFASTCMSSYTVIFHDSKLENGNFIFSLFNIFCSSRLKIFKNENKMAYQLVKLGLPIDVVRIINEYALEKEHPHLRCAKCNRTVLTLQYNLMFPLHTPTPYQCHQNVLYTDHGYCTARTEDTHGKIKIKLVNSGKTTITDPNTLLSIDSNMYSVWSKTYVMKEDYYLKNNMIICFACDMTSKKLRLYWNIWKHELHALEQ
jgi:hypothetical protein